MEISTSILRGLACVLGDEQVETRVVLRSAAIDPDQFAPKKGASEVDLPEPVIRAALQAIDVPGLGLLFGSKAPLQALGVIGGILVHAPSLRRALSALDTYVSLISPQCSFGLREEGTRASLIFASPFLDVQVARFCTEVAFALAWRIGRQLSPRLELQEVRFRNAAPPYHARVSAYFGCKVHYESQRNEIVLARSALDVSQPFEDVGLWHIYKRRGDELLARGRQREPLHERIEQLLRKEVDLGFVSVASIARRLHTTPRHLRRVLGKEGHAVTSLTDKVRCELALRALAESDLPIKEIASRAGYGGVSTFHRAVKRWTGGITPARYRTDALSARSRAAE